MFRTLRRKQNTFSFKTWDQSKFIETSV